MRVSAAAMPRIASSHGPCSASSIVHRCTYSSSGAPGRCIARRLGSEWAAGWSPRARHTRDGSPPSVASRGGRDVAAHRTAHLGRDDRLVRSLVVDGSGIGTPIRHPSGALPSRERPCVSVPSFVMRIVISRVVHGGMARRPCARRELWTFNPVSRDHRGCDWHRGAERHRAVRAMSRTGGGHVSPIDGRAAWRCVVRRQTPSMVMRDASPPVHATAWVLRRIGCAARWSAEIARVTNRINPASFSGETLHRTSDRVLRIDHRSVFARARLEALAGVVASVGLANEPFGAATSTRSAIGPDAVDLRWT